MPRLNPVAGTVLPKVNPLEVVWGVLHSVNPGLLAGVPLVKLNPVVAGLIINYKFSNDYLCRKHFFKDRILIILFSKANEFVFNWEREVGIGNWLKLNCNKYYIINECLKII